MNTIEKCIGNLPAAKARAVCYYLSRHLKQAAIFDEYSKDPFIEADSSMPDDEIRAKTKELLLAIEQMEHMTADKFDDDVYKKWMNSILEFERGLGKNSSITPRVQDFLKRGA